MIASKRTSSTAPGHTAAKSTSSSGGFPPCVRFRSRIASVIEHVSLAAHPDFEDVFVSAMNFPGA